MKKITFIFTFLLVMISLESYAQYGCASGIPITDGYTATGITSPGNGGPEDWNSPNPSAINMCQNATGNALSPNYFSDDVYLFTYTAGANDEEVSMTINSHTTWTGLGIFASCTGTFLNDCLGSSGSTSGGVLTASATVDSGQTVYIAVGQWGTPNAVNFDVTSFSVDELVNPPSCTTLSNPLNGAVDVAINGVITWNAASGGPTNYSLTVGTSSGASDVFSGAVGNITSYNVGTLAYSTPYFVTIIPSNGNGSASGCAEESFTTGGTPPTGSLCSDPLIIGALPYSTTDNTGNYGDDYNGSPGATNCGDTSAYLGGDDVVYAYTATSDTAINVSMTPTATWSGIFVYTDCADIGTACVAGMANSGATERNFDVNITNGVTYYFVISTYPSPQTTSYELVITQNTCSGATVGYTVVNDCDTSGGFLINVEVTDMGSATALTVSDDQGSATQPVTGVSTVTFGPYPNGTEVIITIDDDGDDDSCTLTSPVLTQMECPPSNNDCASATIITQEVDITDAASATPTTGTIEGATASGLSAEACGGWSGSANDDVWYAFEALTENVNITYEINGVTLFDGVAQLYSGTCGSLINIGCADNSITTAPVVEEIQATGLTVGDIYYTRIYQYSGILGTTDKTFDIKIWSSDVLSASAYTNNKTFTYFPNPVSNTLSLRGIKAIQNVAVYNMLGQEMLHSNPKTVNSDVDMSNLQAGTYFVKVTVGNVTKTIKIIKK